MTEINKVQLNIRKFLFETEDATKDEKSAFEWLVSFRKTLQYQELVENPNKFAVSLLCEALSFNAEQRRKSLMSSARRMLISEGIEKPSKEQIEKKFNDVFADEFKNMIPFSKNEECVEIVSVEVVEEDDDKLTYGEFENVFLSKDEYNSLLKEHGNINTFKSVIDEFSSSLADGKVQSQNHYATLQRWIRRRKEWDAEKEQGKETFQEREGRRQTEQLRKAGLLR